MTIIQNVEEQDIQKVTLKDRLQNAKREAGKQATSKLQIAGSIAAAVVIGTYTKDVKGGLEHAAKGYVTSVAIAGVTGFIVGREKEVKSELLD